MPFHRTGRKLSNVISRLDRHAGFERRSARRRSIGRCSASIPMSIRSTMSASRLARGRSGSIPNGTVGPLAYWDVEDLDGTIAELKAAGATVTQEPSEVGRRADDRRAGRCRWQPDWASSIGKLGESIAMHERGPTGPRSRVSLDRYLDRTGSAAPTLAASTSASNGLSCSGIVLKSSSGCHCSPSTNRQPGTETASITPSLETPSIRTRSAGVASDW